MLQEMMAFVSEVLRRRHLVRLFLLIVVLPKVLEIVLGQFVLSESRTLTALTAFCHFINWVGSYYYFAFATLTAYHIAEDREMSASELHRRTIKHYFWIVLGVEIVIAILMIAIVTPIDGATKVLSNSVSTGTGTVWIVYTLSFAIRLLVMTVIRMRLLLAAIAVLVEDHGIWDAVKRSWNITRGQWRALMAPTVALTIPIFIPWLLEYAFNYAPPMFNTDLFSNESVVYSSWGAFDWSVATLITLIELAISLLLPMVLLYLYRRFAERYDSYRVESLRIEDDPLAP
jgi:hypothetical protein